MRGKIAPPPAWIKVSKGSFWLGYSSYCRGGPGPSLCADFVAPSCTDGRTPKVNVRRGELARFHLGFDPNEVSVAIGESGPDSLRRTREPIWPANRDGTMVLFTRGEGRDASYVACLQFTGST